MQTDLTKIGYISKPYGFKGELKSTLDVLMLSEDFPEYIWMYLDGKPIPFFIEKSFFNKQTFLLKIEDIDDEESAMSYKNTSIYCESKFFNKYFEKEESLDDLIGFQVEDDIKGNIGMVSSIIENSIQPTLVILYNGKEILIPYTEEIIQEVDEKNELIRIISPEGLIEMYLE